MNLKELKDKIDFIVKIAESRKDNLEDLEVVVTTEGSSLGCRPKSNVQRVFRGFDWEMNQIRIETEDKLRLNNETINKGAFEGFNITMSDKLEAIEKLLNSCVSKNRKELYNTPLHKEGNIPSEMHYGRCEGRLELAQDILNILGDKDGLSK